MDYMSSGDISQRSLVETQLEIPAQPTGSGNPMDVTTPGTTVRWTKQVRVKDEDRPNMTEAHEEYKVEINEDEETYQAPRTPNLVPHRLTADVPWQNYRANFESCAVINGWTNREKANSCNQLETGCPASVGQVLGNQAGL